MIYKVKYAEGVIRFFRNNGWTELSAGSEEEAEKKTRRMFGHIRNIKFEETGPGWYRIAFDVALDYNLALLRTIELALRVIKRRQDFDTARWLDRYIVVSIWGVTGQPNWYSAGDLDEELNQLRMAAVSAREIGNPADFVDIDIAIFNHLELNSKEGFKSRVIRKKTARPADKTAG